jgi:hypothetical protein
LADRIHARAIRREGELLEEIESAQGRRTDLEPRAGGVPKSPTRSDVATGAGLSERQTKTALRVAKIPEAEFEEAVKSENPPTVTKLAERGTNASRWSTSATARTSNFRLLRG